MKQSRRASRERPLRLGDDPRDAQFGGPLIEFSREVIVGVMRAIHARWLSTSDVTSADGEVKVTERLRAAMRRAVNERPQPWSRMRALLPGTESLSRSDLSHPDGRTDIPIFLLAQFGRFP